MKIDEVASTTKKARVATHTHIKVKKQRSYSCARFCFIIEEKNFKKNDEILFFDGSIFYIMHFRRRAAVRFEFSLCLSHHTHSLIRSFSSSAGSWIERKRRRGRASRRMGRARIRSRSLRRRRGHDQREKNGWKSLAAHRRARHWKDGVGVRHCARVRDESTVLPDGWVGGVLARSEEDGGVDGKLSKSDWFTH